MKPFVAIVGCPSAGNRLLGQIIGASRLGYSICHTKKDLEAALHRVQLPAPVVVLNPTRRLQFLRQSIKTPLEPILAQAEEALEYAQEEGLPVLTLPYEDTVAAPKDVRRRIQEWLGMSARVAHWPCEVVDGNQKYRDAARAARKKAAK